MLESKLAELQKSLDAKTAALKQAKSDAKVGAHRPPRFLLSLLLFRVSVREFAISPSHALRSIRRRSPPPTWR